jgi:hypothetical protein
VFEKGTRLFDITDGRHTGTVGGDGTLTFQSTDGTMVFTVSTGKDGQPIVDASVVGGKDVELFAVKGDTGAAIVEEDDMVTYTSPDGSIKTTVTKGEKGVVVGLSVVGEIKGDTGPTGPTGAQGKRGLSGTRGPTGPTGPIGSVTQAYGGKMSTEADDVTLSGNIRTVVPLPTNLPYKSVNLTAANTITITVAGDYMLQYTLSGQAGGTATLTAGVTRNGAPIPLMSQKISLTTGEDFTISASGIVNLAARDQLRFTLMAGGIVVTFDEEGRSFFVVRES